MAGYSGYSMSNNAVAAYESGERPASKWTKKAIIARILELTAEREGDGEPLSIDIDFIKSLPVKTLKDIALCESSWHHTSKMYNRTKFFDVCLDSVEDARKTYIRRIVRAAEDASSDAWVACEGRTEFDYIILRLEGR